MNAPRKHPLADADITFEARWYDTHQPGLGADSVDEIQRIITATAENPLRYGIRFGHWRRANLRRFPHAVFYPVIGKQPVVFAVLHAKRGHGPILEGRHPSN